VLRGVETRERVRQLREVSTAELARLWMHFPPHSVAKSFAIGARSRSNLSTRWTPAIPCEAWRNARPKMKPYA
jgi:hypothetical protein